MRNVRQLQQSSYYCNRMNCATTIMPHQVKGFKRPRPAHRELLGRWALFSVGDSCRELKLPLIFAAPDPSRFSDFLPQCSPWFSRFFSASWCQERRKKCTSLLLHGIRVSRDLGDELGSSFPFSLPFFHWLGRKKNLHAFFATWSRITWVYVGVECYSIAGKGE